MSRVLGTGGPKGIGPGSTVRELAAQRPRRSSRPPPASPPWKTLPASARLASIVTDQESVDAAFAARGA